MRTRDFRPTNENNKPGPGPVLRIMKMMKRMLIVWGVVLCAVLPAAAQKPLYIVNGTPREEIASIPPEDIERVESLPADEQTIARYGDGASNGVILITLRYDQPAAFPSDSTYSQYIARRVVWNDTDPVARVILRYKITTDGTVVVDQELEVTDKRLKRRILKVMEEAPKWRPAQKDGVPVESEGVLRIQLPEGRRMPRQAELVYR